MAKPTIRAITPFDAALGTTVNFNWSGRQMKAATATIKNASDNSTVYTATQSTYKGVFIIPDDSTSQLVNNTQYKITITVTDMDDVVSEASEPALFYCYTTPVLTMQRLYEDQADAITDGYVCGASNIYIRLNYSHPSAETGNLLNIWKISLYNSSKSILDYSEDMYAANTLDYEFSGLLDLNEYYLRVEATTTSGMLLDTGYVRIVISYSIPARFANLSLVNNDGEGNIQVKSFAVSITGRPKYEPVEYVEDANHEPYAVDLTTGNEIYFNEGIDINKEFTLTMWVSNLELYETFLVLSDDGGNDERKYELRYWKTTANVNGTLQDQYQIWLYGNNNNCSFSLWSNAFLTEPASTDKLAILLARDSNGIFTLKWMNLS